MNDIVTESPPESSAVNHALADLERRVQSLETKVAALPDVKHVEDRITAQVKASIPPPVPPIDPTIPPGFKDIEMPIPSMQSVVNTAKTTWMFFEMLAELKLLFWTLFDRRYHIAWITRLITIVLLIMILTSDYWFPLATYDNFISQRWDKIVNLLFCLILFLVLNFETRRYKEWRSKR
jgi:hypothetical protein